MKKRKTVTKSEILEAIKKELVPGEWVKLDRNLNPVIDGNCNVCAVGAVLRKVGYLKSQRLGF